MENDRSHDRVNCRDARNLSVEGLILQGSRCFSSS